MSQHRDVVTFRLDQGYRDKMEAQARELGITLSAHIRTVLRNHAERADLKNLSQIVTILARKVQGLEEEIRLLRQEFRDAVEQ